ncbi:MAG: hypothetical protein C4321_09005, partial [Chloroflexota bacterium]
MGVTTTTSPVTPTDAKRAEIAINRLQQPGRRSKEYVARVKGFPAQLAANGLLQTLAFLMGADTAARQVAEDLAAWLTNREHSPLAQVLMVGDPRG